MLSNAREKILVADATKFGKFALSLILPLDRIDVLVTDVAPGADWIRGLEAEQVRCVFGGETPKD